jgi:Flp pilus assembly pilin Flp
MAGHSGRAEARSGTNTDPKGQEMNLFVLKSWLQAKFAKDEQGANLVEYILLVALIALAVIAAVVFLRGQVNSKFDQTGSKLSAG